MAFFAYLINCFDLSLVDRQSMLLVPMTHTIFMQLVDHAMHGITAIVVALYFCSRWLPLLKNCRRYWRMIARMILLTACADAVTVIWYLFFMLVGTAGFSLSGGFLCTALLLYSLRWVPVRADGTYNLRTAFILGAVQGIALLPGISRLASTYVAARWLRMPHRMAFELSFVLQWPLITLAALRALAVLAPTFFVLPFSVVSLGALCLSAGGSYLLIWWVDYLGRTDRLWWFAWYLMIPALLAFFVC